MSILSSGLDWTIEVMKVILIGLIKEKRLEIVSFIINIDCIVYMFLFAKWNVFEKTNCWWQFFKPLFLFLFCLISRV